MKPFELFKIKNISKRNPYYELYFEMDYNDGDYVGKKIIIKEEDDLVWLLIMYLSCYPEHWEDDEFLNSIKLPDSVWGIGEVLNNCDLMWHSGDWPAHSYTYFELTYCDSRGIKRNVDIPDYEDYYTEEQFKELLESEIAKKYE